MSERKAGDWLDAYMLYTDNTEPSRLYRRWAGLGVIASCLGRKCYVEWETKIYPNMYIVLVGPSTARKGTALRPAREILFAQDTVNIAAESTTREALIRRMKGFTRNEVTEDGLGQQVTELVIWNEELTVFLGRNEFTLLDNLCDWYDCKDRWTYDTKGEGTDRIYGMCVNLIGATTPEMIVESLPKEAIGGGLTSRIIFIYAARKEKLVLEPFKTDAERELEEKLNHDLLDIQRLNGEFTKTRGYIERRHRWYEEQDRNPPFLSSRFAAYLGRRPTHLLKLSMALSASRDNSMILDEEIFERAVRILNEAEVMMPNSFRGFGRNPMAQIMVKITTFLENRRETTFTDLQRIFFDDIEKIELKTIIEHLRDIGYVKLIPEKDLVIWTKGE